jgi:hypothetical protein
VSTLPAFVIKKDVEKAEEIPVDVPEDEGNISDF